jgi:hypothetical protein
LKAQGVLAALLWLLSHVPGAAAPAAVHGITTTQRGAIRLPGAEITVTEADTGRQVVVVVSDQFGGFRVGGLVPGRYNILARLAGFTDRQSGPIVLAEDQDAEVNLDLEVAPVSDTVNVTGEAGLAQAQTGVSGDTVSGQMVDLLPVAVDSYLALLPVLPGIVRQPDGRISMKGARPTQGGVQIGRGSGVDPSTGNVGLELPSDAVESVDVVASPYGAEDGRLSSSLVRIQTRAGSNVWSAVANAVVPIPCLKICDGDTMGITSYQPRGWFGGPLAKDRLFIAQGAQYRWNRTRVPSLPEDANDTVTQNLYLFTRLDAHLAPGHTLTTTAAVFPRAVDGVNLNTFNPVAVAPNSRQRGYSVTAADHLTLSNSSFLESNVSVSYYHSRVFGNGEQDMELTTEGNRGTFFNTQERRTHVYQWTESLQFVRHAAGEHLFRVGFDLMYAAYGGTSLSRPVLVRRADGTLSQRFDFVGPTSQQVRGSDVATFVQDRWQVTPRVVLEPGLRFDRDGVLGRSGVSPRFGFAATVLPRAVGVLRGGAGTFYERTPLNVAAFGSFEAATLTRYAADGATPVGSPLTYVHRAGVLETPRAFVWNLEYDHRFGSKVLVKLNHLQRRGSREAVLEPRQSDHFAELLLDSVGRSRYLETELTVRYGLTDARALTLSYVRSHLEANLNAFDLFYGDFRNPVVRPDQYATGPTDVPNRFIARGVLTLRDKWTLSTLVEIRNGFPYSIINQDQEYVGVRNAGGRFPNLYTCDASLLRTAMLRRQPVRFGVRFYHIFNAFSPRDVQNNIDSPAFGGFYNGIVRRVTLTFQFVRR